MSFPHRNPVCRFAQILSLLLLAAMTWPRVAPAAQLSLSWTDNSTNENGFKIERKTGTSGTFAQIATLGKNLTTYTDAGLATATTYCYRARAYNTAGNSAYSNGVCGTTTSDTQPPTVSLTAPTNGATVSGSSVTVSASASDNIGVVGVRFLLDGAGLGSEDTTAPYSIIWNTTTATNGSHSLAAVARDAAGNHTTSATVTVTVNNPIPPPTDTAGLVAAYNFDEGSGATVADASGNANHGTISGATWTTQGKFGNALSFNGTSNWVTVNDAPSLDLTTAMTLEAWVRPLTAKSDFRALIVKNYTYYLYASVSGYCGNGMPVGGIKVAGNQGVCSAAALPLNTWTHIAVTYNGSTLVFYKNGVRVASATATGTIPNSTNTLQIGASQFGEYFQGLIDEVRIYKRALTTSEIQADMKTPIRQQMDVRIGVFRPSTGKWYLDLNGNGKWDGCTVDACLGPFGQQGYRPLVGDWTGTGTAKIGVLDPSTFLWRLDRNGNDLWEGCTVDSCVRSFGTFGDLPVIGRWKTGASTDRIGIYRPSQRVWRLDLNGNGLWDGCTVDGCLGPFGTSSQLPVVGDWTGTGTAKVGVFDPSTGLWKLDRNGNGQVDSCTVDGCLGPFGISGDLPIAGDWTGTGTAKIGVFDPSTGLWELDLNGNGRWDGCAVDGCLGSFGLQGDLPVVGKW